jgi:hypothetical protein
LGLDAEGEAAMSFSGRAVPEEYGGGRLAFVPALLLRVMLAGLLATLVVGAGSLGMLFSSGPEWTSLVFEPVSLLLLPGLLVGILYSGPHDLDPHMVLLGTILFYFLLFWAVLEWRAWRRI